MNRRSAQTDTRLVDPKPAYGSTLDQLTLRFMRFAAVRERTGLSRSTIWRLERVGAFPKHHRISSNAVAWVEQDVVDWMQDKASSRRGPS
jgi:prophage regulatory protein